MSEETEGGAQREMPKWDCHKTVWALPIARIVRFNENYQLHFAEEGYAPRLVHLSVLERPLETFGSLAALEGGYFVVYEGGYESWSPRAEFEGGYTRQKDPA